MFKYYFLLFLVTTLFFLTACHREESEKTKEQPSKGTAKDVIIKIEDSTPEEETQGADAASETSQASSDSTLVLEDLTGQIQSVIAPISNTGGAAAVYVQNLSTGAQASVNNQPMQSASLIKLYIASCVYEQMPTLLAMEAYSGETDELLANMITVSDNDAANTLVTRLGSGDPVSGMAVVNQFCQTHGFTDTHMGRLMLASNDLDDNYTSVNDCGKFIREIYTEALPGASSILSLMQRQERTEKIPSGVPDGVTTANKTGELADVENDAAIIFSQNGAYTICVMMSGLSDSYAARVLITELSSQIYQYMCP